MAAEIVAHTPVHKRTHAHSNRQDKMNPSHRDTTKQLTSATHVTKENVLSYNTSKYKYKIQTNKTKQKDLGKALIIIK